MTSHGAESAVRGVGGRATVVERKDGSSEGTPASLAAARWLRQNGLSIAVGLAIFWLAFDDGTYSLTARSTVAIVVWVAVAVGAALALWPRDALTGSSIVLAVLLGSFAAFQGLSAAWGESAENAFAEFNRVALYLGVFSLVALAARRGSARQWNHGLALGVVAVGLLALTSRLFPDLLGRSDVDTFNPGEPRLSYPVEYWNGLAVLIALGLPFLLHAAVCARNAWTARLALAPFPALVAAMYFTSSRGGAVVGLVALGAFVALTTRRPAALAAALVALVGSAIVIVGLQGKSELVNGQLDSSAIASQGRAAAVLIAVACLATAFGWAFVRRVVPAQVHLSLAVKRAAIALGVLIVVGGVVAADPEARFEKLKEPPREFETAYVQSHILSSGGSGRWQFWEAAVEQFESAPLLGAGAGSYAAWWAEHGTLNYFTRNGHSLFFETLGELGVVGIALLLALVGVAAMVATRRLRAARGEDRAAVAALTAALIAFLLAAATDWVWDLTVVAVIAIVCLGVLAGPASVFPAEPGRAWSLADLRRHAVWRVAAVLAALAFVAAQAIPLLAHRNVRESQEKLREGDVAGALAAARDARSFQGWAASTHLQLALAEEHRGHLDAARESIHTAIDRDPSDWQLWAVASRIEEERGAGAAARANFERARALNPRSSLFADSKAR